MAALLLVLVVATIRSRFDDPDMWWHLRTGEIIAQSHSIPTTDEFSFTTNHHPYVPHEWLAQLSIYAAWKVAGNSGLMLWLSFWSALLVIGSYLYCILYSENVKLAFMGALIAWVFGTVGFAIRPQMIGYCLLLVELLILYLGSTRSHRWFLALPPLFALWVNTHGSFFLGMLILAVVACCSFLEFRLGPVVAHRWERRRSLFLCAALLLSVAALFINPIGVAQVTYPINTMSEQKLALANTTEWLPLPFDDVRTYLLWGVVLLVSWLPALRAKQIFLHEVLLVALGLALAAPHARMMIVFGILSAPVLCRLLADAWEGYVPEKDKWLPNAFLTALSLALCFVAFPSAQNLQAQVEKNSPVKAADFVRHSHLSGNMLNSYVYGGFLIWSLPEHKVFIDGRADVFEWSGVMSDFGSWATLQTDPRRLLDKYSVNFCLLASTDPMANVLPLMPGWTKIYSDGSAIIFSRL